MIDRAKRDLLAEKLRQLVSGAVNNLEFDELADEKIRSKDRAPLEIFDVAWNFYDDFHVHPFQLTDGLRQDFSRAVLFLHSDKEYEWPRRWPFFITFPVWLMDHFTGRRFKLSQRLEGIQGDRRYWPFFRKEDYLAALAEPRLLAGR